MSEQMNESKSTKTKAKKRDTVTPKIVKRDLEVKLSESEVLKRIEELLDASQARDALRSLKSEQTSNINAEIKLAEQRVRDLNAALRNKKEKREVERFERMVFPTNTVEVVRADTNEVVERRAMTVDERQATLPGVDAPKSGEPLTATVAEVAGAKKGRKAATVAEVLGDSERAAVTCGKEFKGQTCTRPKAHRGAHGHRDPSPKA
jgi:hypothetical protein